MVGCLRDDDQGHVSGPRAFQDSPGCDTSRPAAGTCLTHVINQRKGRRLERIGVRVTSGQPMEQPYLIHLERIMWTWRDRLTRLTRKTRGFGEDVATWAALFSVAHRGQNWLQPNIALRVPLTRPRTGCRYHPRTLAMTPPVTDHR